MRPNILRFLLERMPEAPTRVIEDGRVTIPAHIRREIGVEKGDYVMVDVRPLDGGPNSD
jgi:AbrB family looped-hinge helix DNA binding protein